MEFTYADFLVFKTLYMSDFFFFNLVCESCIEPVPLCSEGEILTVDLNTIHYCCPHYFCGECNCCEFDITKFSKNDSVWVCKDLFRFGNKGGRQVQTKSSR